MRPHWSSAASSVWGKTDPKNDRCLALVQHLEDAAGVAGHVWDTWVPRVVRERLAAEVGSDRDARILVTFLAGTHDVGKASPAFAQLAHSVQMGHLVTAMERQGLRSPTLPADQRERHTLTGHVAMAEWLQRRWDYPAARASALASIVSAHHGTPAPGDDAIDRVRRFTGAMGDHAWDRVRDEILDTMSEVMGAGPVLSSIRDTKLSLHALVDLSALVIMADWIASDEDRFPYDVGRSASERLRDGLDDLDLRRPWAPEPPTDARGLFHARFPHLRGVEPSPLQVEAFVAASQATSAPLMLIEAPTGAGKSEAAFLAAEVLASRSGAGGVYVGLPTMATSNAMFGRVLRWVDAWPGVDDPTMWLAHGKAALNDDFAGLVRDSRISAVHDDDDPRRGSVRVSAWLTGRRRGLLANVVVGTIDQVLMGALQARHLALRHLALSSKVVIVDEVHSADTYMRSYLCRMLEYLGGYGTPVILLSATLPPVQRRELVDAYQRGRVTGVRPSPAVVVPRRRGLSQDEGSAVEKSRPDLLGPGPESYPLVTMATEQTAARPVAHDSRRFQVSLEPIEDDLDVLAATLQAALVDGGCVAVIRNTVRRAQEAYDVLRARFGADVELYHSRFLAAERSSRERRLVQRLGPDRSERPQRLVVVGTQVLEQSLDIDLDLMVTDIAPVDLVIQRVGRLHRHARPDSERPPGLRRPRCLVAGVEDWTASVPLAEPGTSRVYETAHLLRSLSVLTPYLTEGTPLRLPQAGPVLVHKAYDPQLLPPAGWEEPWQHAEESLHRTDDRSRTKAAVHQAREPGRQTTLTGWTRAPLDDAHEDAGRAAVRDSEDGIEVILLQRDSNGRLRLLPGDFPGAGSEVPHEPDDRDPVTRHLAACTVGLPQSLTSPWRWDATIGELESSPVVETWQRSRWLAGQLALVLDSEARATLNKHVVTYSSERGLDVTPIADAEEVT